MDKVSVSTVEVVGLLRRCPMCGVEFEQKTMKGRPQIYHSPKCRNLWNIRLYRHRRRNG